MQDQNFQQRQDQKIQKEYEERSRIENLYRQGLISEDKYRENLKRIQDRLSATKGITSFSKPSSSKKSFTDKWGKEWVMAGNNQNGYRYVPTDGVKTEKGWGLANNDPYGYYKRQREEMSAARKEKLAPYGDMLGKDYRYFYDDWQEPMYGNDGYGNNIINGWGTVPEKSYINNKPTVQTPQFNF